MEEVVTPARQAVLEHLITVVFGVPEDRPGDGPPPPPPPHVRPTHAPKPPRDREVSCRRHSWMVEQQTNHRYCHVCGKHGW